MEQFHGTTIVSVRRRTPDRHWQGAIGGDHIHLRAWAAGLNRRQSQWCQ
ncbi:MAG: hypothetical protein ACOVK6_06855 [Ramlibacter sp.]